MSNACEFCNAYNEFLLTNPRITAERLEREFRQVAESIDIVSRPELRPLQEILFKGCWDAFLSVQIMAAQNEIQQEQVFAAEESFLKFVKYHAGMDEINKTDQIIADPEHEYHGYLPEAVLQMQGCIDPSTVADARYSLF
jgi:hypothetical protein